ncbi:MAG: hypothetical protein P8Z49_00680 [Acidobacteriota bacterium]
MEKILKILLACTVLAATGCTLTLNPLFTLKDGVYEPSLVGTWRNTEATFAIRPFDKSTGRYSVQVHIEEQPPAKFEATLGKIGAHLFLELTPQRSDALHPKSFYGAHFIALHSFWKVNLYKDALSLSSMSTKWLDSLIKAGKCPVSFKKTANGLLFLTARTSELKKFVKKYEDDPEAFPTSGDERGVSYFHFERVDRALRKDETEQKPSS